MHFHFQTQTHTAPQKTQTPPIPLQKYVLWRNHQLQINLLSLPETILQKFIRVRHRNPLDLILLMVIKVRVPPSILLGNMFQVVNLIYSN